jgi:hypothetical protein
MSLSTFSENLHLMTESPAARLRARVLRNPRPRAHAVRALRQHRREPRERPGQPRRAAGLDEGLLPVSLPILVYMETPCMDKN